GGVVGLNALIGGVQRYRTETAIKDLAKSARRRALVRRGGKLVEVDSSRLVKGDIVMLGAGDVVPADCRVIETEVLEVDTSSLTGESLPVRKSAAPSYEASLADRSSMLYEGTSIASGQATAVVVAAGEETEARRGAASAKRAPTESGVERRLRSLIDMTGPVALGAGIGLVSAGLLRGRKLEDLVGSGVSLAVASVPEGLPLLATAAQLAAANRLSQRGALVRNARSIEALGRVDVLCVDKTGTVTQGKISLSSISDGVDEQLLGDLSGPRIKVLAAALRATPSPDRSLSQADPTDAALLRAAQTLAIQPDYNCAGWQRRSELPFEAARGFHAVLGSARDGKRLSVKGAPEAILPKCTRYKRGADQAPLDEAARRRLMQLADQLARRGLRVLAVAERFVGPEDVLVPERLMGLIFRGFLAFSDPVRPSAAAAVHELKRAGVRTIMITGDHPSTAEAIATELAIMSGKLIISGAQLARLSDEELDACIDDVAVFARVTPSQKVRVVRALQRNDHTVAMVGDGANDAPAIRLADVGIAIGEQSTSAARSAADIVLTDERIETLVHAISEGRAMWASVRDAVSILVGGNLGEIGFTLAAGLFDGRPPLSARQLLLVNLLTDVAPAMAIALRPPTRETLASLANEGPDASLAEPLNRDIAARAVVTALGAGTAWAVGRFTGTRTRANTLGLLALVGTQLGQTITSGGFSRPVITTSLASAGLLAIVVQTPFLSQFFGCQPLGPVGWATALGASAFATSAGIYGPRVARAWLEERQRRRVPFAPEPEALPSAHVELAPH
ncbi:MAG TPA: cation-transporting P-type ATPase, partial [Polyangiaceae bacterium]|nr:cation-transporting P-type ATPase [Polyangiaceae bacterium]